MLALAGLLALTVSCRQGEEPPTFEGADVVFIVIDTLRADHLSFHGYGKETAPFLAGLAAEGVVFQNACSPSSWTAPATASLFTSLHPFQHQVLTGLMAADEWRVPIHRIPAELETIGELFQAHGYATFAVTDNVNVGAMGGFDQGFDRFQSYCNQGSGAVHAKLLEWQEEIEEAERAFVYLHYMEPHLPYEGREPWYRSRADPVEDAIAAYDSEIRYLDAAIEELFERFGWRDNALVVITSDHGEEFRDHGGTTHGFTLFGEVLNVPLVLHGSPEWAGGRTVSTPVSLLDLLPTLSELLGFAARSEHEGVSLVPLVEGETGTFEDRILYSHLQRMLKRPDGSGYELRIRSAIRGRWKLIADSDQGTMLFDLREDPGERNNRARLSPKRVRSLASSLTELEERARRYHGEDDEITLTPEQVEQLRTLGYVQ